MKTCNECTFNCKAADNEVCERFKDQALYGSAPKRYKVFLTSSIEHLKYEVLLGEAETYREACKLISDNVPDNKYWRFLMNDTGTFIDYGSWSRFAAIVPPVPMKEMLGEE